MSILVQPMKKTTTKPFSSFQQFFNNPPPSLFQGTPKMEKTVQRSQSQNSHTKRKVVDYRSIKIFARFRPTEQLDSYYRIVDNTIVIDGAQFAFDRVFDNHEESQRQVYMQVAQPTVRDFLSGINGSIIAYGQTGSGKTYTMMGSTQCEGIVMRSLREIFDNISEVQISILEVYKEVIYDLLGQNNELKLKEASDGFYVERLSKIQVSTAQQCSELLRLAEDNRHMAETKLNLMSSRSHLILTIYLKRSKLHLVDLAGSEKVSKSGASGESLQEAKKINYSLSCLGHVIQCLAQGLDHIPYRDSKLTKLLQDSLQSDCRTSIIATCSSSIVNKEESISSLKFAQRAKYIKCELRTHKKSYKDLEQEVFRLQLELEESKSKVSQNTSVSNFHTRYTTDTELNCSVRMTHMSEADCSVGMPQSGIDVYEVQSKLSYLLNEFSQIMKENHPGNRHQQFSQQLLDLNNSFQVLSNQMTLHNNNNVAQNRFVEAQQQMNRMVQKILDTMEPHKLSFHFTIQNQLQQIQLYMKQQMQEYQNQLNRMHQLIKNNQPQKGDTIALKLVCSPIRQDIKRSQSKSKTCLQSSVSNVSSKYLKRNK